MTMQLHIHRLSMGFANCYLIQHEGMVLVDCATPGQSDALCRRIKALSVRPEDIGLIAITHGHFDHTGSACEMARRTGAKVAIHSKDKKWLEEGQSAPARPLGTWGKVLVIAVPLVVSRMRLDRLVPDIVVGDEGLPLDDYGIPGKLVYTPGHTAGSMTVVLSDGSAFVGDLAMSGPPALRWWGGLPIIADDAETLAASWRRLLNDGVTTVYPGHGKPFAAKVMAPLVAAI